MFGSYPTQENINAFEEDGVRVFVDLTHSSESKIVPYNTKYRYISYPITDNNIPTNIKNFCSFVYKLCDVIVKLGTPDKIYIHCKGGHGRSGVVVACLVCKLLHMQPLQSIEYTNYCHNKRTVMRDLWRHLGSPQTYLQKKLVHDLCGNTNIDSNNELSIDFKSNVNIQNIGIFRTARLAIDKLVSDGVTTEDAVKIVLLAQFKNKKKIKKLLQTGLRNIRTRNTGKYDIEFMKILVDMRYNYVLEDYVV